MSIQWYDALRDVLDWIKNKQEAAIIYHLLKNDGRVPQTAKELSAPQATVVLCRDGLVDAGYLKVMVQTFEGDLIRRSARGNALFKALKVDRGEADDRKI